MEESQSITKNEKMKHKLDQNVQYIYNSSQMSTLPHDNPKNI